MPPNFNIASAMFPLDLRRGNRRPPIAGLPDWSQVGYRGGEALPDDGQITFRITAQELARTYGVVPNNGRDHSDGLQHAINAVKTQHAGSFSRFALIELPAGTINISRQIAVDTSFLIIRGQGRDLASPDSTRIVFRPNAATRYALSDARGKWLDEQADGTANWGWIWPGRGAFRVQVRDVHPRYTALHRDSKYRELYEGSVNFHWRSGFEVQQGKALAGRVGQTTIKLNPQKADMSVFHVGEQLWLLVPVSSKEYESWGARREDYADHLFQLMRQQMFTITNVDVANHQISIDKPLEFDVWPAHL
jgi:hypothetical protein